MTTWTPTDDGFADLTDHDTFTNGVPHNTFRRLRDMDPIHWTDYNYGIGFWSITRHQDICVKIGFYWVYPRHHRGMLRRFTA